MQIYKKHRSERMSHVTSPWFPNLSLCPEMCLNVPELILDSGAITTTGWIAPCHHGPVCQNRGKSFACSTNLSNSVQLILNKKELSPPKRPWPHVTTLSPPRHHKANALLIAATFGCNAIAMRLSPSWSPVEVPETSLDLKGVRQPLCEKGPARKRAQLRSGVAEQILWSNHQCSMIYIIKTGLYNKLIMFKESETCST